MNEKILEKYRQAIAAAHDILSTYVVDEAPISSDSVVALALSMLDAQIDAELAETGGALMSSAKT